MSTARTPSTKEVAKAAGESTGKSAGKITGKSIDKITGKEKARYHHGDLRKALISAVYDQIRVNGVDALSLADACRALGVSTAAPYRHFKDKEEILAEAVIQGFREMTATFQAAASSQGEGSQAAIVAIGQAYVGFACANAGLFRLMFSEAQAAYAEMTRPAGTDCFGVLVGQVVMYCRAHAPGSDVPAICARLWTFVHGAAALKIDGKYERVTPGLDVDKMIADATPGLLET